MEKINGDTLFIHLGNDGYVKEPNELKALIAALHLKDEKLVSMFAAKICWISWTSYPVTISFGWLVELPSQRLLTAIDSFFPSSVISHSAYERVNR